MRLNEVQEVLRRQPFEAFRVQLTNGQSYVIQHPAFAALSRSSFYVGVSSGDDEVPDRYVQCDLLHIVAIEPVNGKRRRTKRKPRN